MAKRLIDATNEENWAREHILDAKERSMILDFLRNCATVPAVEVVRCRDCKHHRTFRGRDMCAKNAKLLDGHEVGLHATGENDFCSYGERKEKDD